MFWCDWDTFFWFFLFFVSSSLVCVVPWSTAMIFVSNVKALTFSGLPVSSISPEAMNSASKPFTNRQPHPHYQSGQYPIMWIFGLWRHHCQYQNVFFCYCSFFSYTHTHTCENLKLTFIIYVNKSVMQGLVNIEGSCILFFNKTIHIMKPTNM